METEIRDAYKKRWCPSLFDLPPVADCDYIPIQERSERIKTLFGCLLSTGELFVPLTKVIALMLTCGEAYTTVVARKMYAGLLSTAKSKGRGNRIDETEFTILLLELTHSATEEIFTALLKHIKAPWNQSKFYLTESTDLSNELFQMFHRYDKTSSGTISTAVLKDAISQTGYDINLYKHLLSDFPTNSDITSPPVSLFGVTTQTTITYFKSILSFEDAAICTLTCLSNASRTKFSSNSAQLQADVQLFCKNYVISWKREEDRRFKPFATRYRSPEFRNKELSESSEAPTHIECHRCGDCALCIDGNGQLMETKIAYCKKCNILHSDWNRVTSAYAATKMLSTIDLHGKSMKAVEEREINRAACISFTSSESDSVTKADSKNSSECAAPGKQQNVFSRKHRKRPATAKAEVIRHADDEILIRCSHCSRVMLDMDSTGHPLRIVNCAHREVPIECPGCKVSSKSWKRVNLYDELQEIELKQPWLYAKKVPKPPTPPVGERRMSRRRSTPLIKCQRCGRNQIRVDQMGKPLPLSSNAYGDYSPLDCPGCNIRHTDWVPTPIPLQEEQEKLRPNSA